MTGIPQLIGQVNSVTPSYETCGGPHSYYECQAASGYTQDVYATTGNYNPGGHAYQPQGDHLIKITGIIRTEALQERPQGALPSNTIPNFKGEIKAITTRSGNVLAGPSVPPPPLSSSSKEVERDPEIITDHVLPKSIVRVPPLVVQPSPSSRPSEIPFLFPTSSSSFELPKRNPHQPQIPYPSRLNKEKLQDKSDIQVH
ncbi:hypothetical protein Tco_0763737, partial [Tanacetum coccineum]